MRTGKSGNRRPLTFYTKPNCPLCDEARDILQEVEGKFPVEITEVNILSDPSIYEQFKHTIPVVIVDGRFNLWGRIDKDELFRYLAKG